MLHLLHESIALRQIRMFGATIRRSDSVRHDRNMRDKLSWPVRYAVTIRSSLGQTRKLHVLTWLGPEKALAMAAHADGQNEKRQAQLDDYADQCFGVHDTILLSA